jgi:serine/threonine-protein kinase
VYSARHGVLGREVAVKMSIQGAAAGRDAQQRIIREAHMCATVRDAHVPRIYALDRLPDGTIYIVMEKVPGLPLPQITRGRRLPLRHAIQVTCAVLDALHAVHKKGIVHRDVKPSNLLVDMTAESPPRVCLLDFGVGKVVSSKELNFPDLTRKGDLLGTPMYMAPEQMLGQPVDARTDLYAAGIMLYELLAGRPPYPANSVAEVFAAVLRDDITPLSALRAGLPAALHEAVRKAISRKPDDRFDSARDMRKALEAGLAEVWQRPELAALAELEELLLLAGGEGIANDASAPGGPPACETAARSQQWENTAGTCEPPASERRPRSRARGIKRTVAAGATGVAAGGSAREQDRDEGRPGSKPGARGRKAPPSARVPRVAG